MLLTIIIACEIGFWVLMLAGLTARYVLRRPRLGAALLICVPVVDLVLLGATVLHLRDGATADFTHGLAAAYLGFTVAFGHRTIRAADVRFAHRFAGGPAPVRVPRRGPERVRHEWTLWRRGALAWAVACVLLLAGVALVADAERTAELLAWTGRLTALLAVALLWPLAATLRARRPKAGLGAT